MKSLIPTLSPIGRRLLTALLFISGVISLSSTAFLVWRDYREGLAFYEETINKIAHSYQPSISYSLWSFDNQQLTAQLQGIMNFSGITYVQIDQNGDVLMHQGDVLAMASSTLVVPLYYLNNNLNHPLGYLRINQSHQELYNSLYQHAVDILLTQLLLFLIVSIIVLWVLHQLVTRRLSVLAQWAFSFNLEEMDAPLNLESDAKNDEFSLVAAAINHMRRTLKKDVELRHQEQNELKQLQNQLALAVDNAELGFCRYLQSTDHLQCNHHFAQHLGLEQSLLESLHQPLSELFNRIRGVRRQIQIHQIKQVLAGNHVRLNKRLMIEVREKTYVLDLSFQVLTFDNNQPDEILICSLDRTLEYELTCTTERLITEHQAQLKQQYILASKEKDRFKNDKKTLEKEIRQLKTSQQPKHIQSLTNLMWMQLQSWQHAISPHDFELWESFLTTNLYQPLEPLDLCQMVIKLTENALQPYNIKLAKVTPQALITDENPQIIKLLLNNLLGHFLLKKTHEARLSITTTGQQLHCEWTLSGIYESNFRNSLALQLAHIIIQVRLAGRLTITQNKQQIILLLNAPLRT